MSLVTGTNAWNKIGVKPRISEHAGDPIISSDMWIMRMCESVEGNACIYQDITDFPVIRVRDYGSTFSYMDQECRANDKLL